VLLRRRYRYQRCLCRLVAGTTGRFVTTTYFRGANSLACSTVFALATAIAGTHFVLCSIITTVIRSTAAQAQTTSGSPSLCFKGRSHWQFVETTSQRVVYPALDQGLLDHFRHAHLSPAHIDKYSIMMTSISGPGVPWSSGAFISLISSYFISPHFTCTECAVIGRSCGELCRAM